MFSAAIFDFDGTIVQSQAQAYEVLQTIALERNVQLPSIDAIRNYTHDEILRIMRVRFWELPWLTRRARRDLARHIDKINLIPGIEPIIQELAAKRFPIALLSSNSVENINLVLRKYKLERCFGKVVAGVSIFGKRRALQRLCNFFAAEPKQILYIGDEVRDMHAAKAAGLSSCAAGWGFHAESLLRRAAPDFYVSDPCLLPEILAPNR